MSIHHEVHFTNLIQNDCRQADPFIEGAIDALPALWRDLPNGAESPIEFVIAIQTPNDQLGPDRFDSAINGYTSMNLIFEFVKRQQFGGLIEQGIPYAI